MTKPQALVIRTSGTNCEDETARALELGGAATDVIHFHRVLDDATRLAPYKILVFAGGFSYGDDIAAGRVWGLEMRAHLQAALQQHVADGGLVLGVCNGFQVLVESGLVPGLEPGAIEVALASNRFAG